MKTLSYLGAFLGLALFAAPAPAQVELAWKFKSGDTFYAQTEMTMKQSVNVLGMNQNIDTKMTVTLGFAVKAVNGDDVVLEQTFEGTKVDGNPLAGMMEEAMDKIKGLKISFTFNAKTHDISKIEGAKDMIKKLTEDNPQMAQMMGSIMNEDALKQQLAGIFTFLPKKPVNKGDSWDNKSTVSLGPLGAFKTEQKFTYEGQVDKDGKKLEKIVGTGKMTYVSPKEKEKDGKENAAMPFEIVKADFKADDIKTTFYFDAGAGRLSSSETKNKFKGAMTISAQGMEIAMEMEQEQDATTKIMEKKPAK